MAGLFGSVGAGGRNDPRDVRLIQRLLNARRLPGMPRLAEDGVAGPKTIDAIRKFQGGPVGQRHPDGRVDPGRKTFRTLRSNDRRPPAAAAAGPPATPEQAREHRERRRDFVKPGVKETPLTRRILDAIAPAFEGTRAKVISGYMNDSDLYWKVNYHWEYLLWMIEHAARLDVSEKVRGQLSSLRAALLGVAPRPASGYRTSGVVGKPVDQTDNDAMTRRHRVVAQTKRSFKEIVRREKLKQKSKRTGTSFDYAVAPVAHPGTSKHATGYAIDVKGDNNAISAICKRLGASLVFDEKSHVHVEFKNGVSPPR